MKNIVSSFIIGLLFAILPGCSNKDTCTCRSGEDCINGKCVLQENTFYLNDMGITGVNLFRGVVPGSICPDTILLDVKPLHSQPQPPQYSLWVKRNDAFRIENLQPFVTVLAPDEYYLGTTGCCGKYMCSQNGVIYYADFYCKVFRDSVNMDLFFFTANWDGSNRQYIDTTSLTLFKR